MFALKFVNVYSVAGELKISLHEGRDVKKIHVIFDLQEMPLAVSGKDIYKL